MDLHLHQEVVASIVRRASYIPDCFIFHVCNYLAIEIIDL